MGNQIEGDLPRKPDDGPKKSSGDSQKGELRRLKGIFKNEEDEESEKKVF